jgi:thioredoxin-related protein
MVKNILFTIFLATFAFSGTINWSKDNLKDTINNAKDKKQKLIMAYYWQKNCNACEYMSDRVFTKDEVSKFINKNFIPYKTDILTDEYPVYGFPAIYFIDKNGKQVSNPIVGAKNLNDFMLIIEDINDFFEN